MFASCTSLTAVDIPETVISIGGGAFINCDYLSSIDIPNNVTSIGKRAFSQCPSLTSVTIGQGLKSIGEQAFYYSMALTKVYCYASTPPTCEIYAFEDASNNKATLYVPIRCGDKYKSSRTWGSYFKKIKEME